MLNVTKDSQNSVVVCFYETKVVKKLIKLFKNLIWLVNN